MLCNISHKSRVNLIWSERGSLIAQLGADGPRFRVSWHFASHLFCSDAYPPHYPGVILRVATYSFDPDEVEVCLPSNQFTLLRALLAPDASARHRTDNDSDAVLTRKESEWSAAGERALAAHVSCWAKEWPPQYPEVITP
jgi:hypothetical protein